MIANRHYLVTGGSGFIGSALVRHLLDAGARVRILDDDSRGSPRRLAGLEERVEMVRADVRDRDAVIEASQGIDVMCHLAFVNGTEFFYEKPELVLDVGVRGMLSVLDACEHHGIRDFILASSSEVYQTPSVIPTPEAVPLTIPDPLNPRYSYAGGKLISELLAINYGRRLFDKLFIFRPHNVFGPDMGFEHVIPQFASRMMELERTTDDPLPFPIQGTGEETRAFIYIDDFVRGFDAMLRGEPGIYHIGNEEEVSIRQVAEEVGRAFGRTVAVAPGALTQGSTQRRCPDTTKLRSLGYSQQISLAEGVARTARWYRDNRSLAPIKLKD